MKRASSHNLSGRTSQIGGYGHRGRGGDYYEVDAVRMRAPGRDGTVDLDMPDTEGFHPASIPTGWQTPTARIGYLAPLTVVYEATTTELARCSA